MAAKMPNHIKVLNFKATPEQIETWKEVSYASRRTLSRWIRDTLDAAANGTPLPAPPPPAPALPVQEKVVALAAELVERVKETKTTKTPCERRLPQGAFCKWCGRIHK